MINDDGRKKGPSEQDETRPPQENNEQARAGESDTLLMSGFSELRLMGKKRKAPGPREHRQDDMERLFHPAQMEEELFQVKASLQEVRKDLEDLWLAIKRIELSRQETTHPAGAVPEQPSASAGPPPVRGDENPASGIEPSLLPGARGDGDATMSLQDTAARASAIYERAASYLEDLKDKIVKQEPFRIEEAVALVRDVVDSPGLVDEVYQLILVTEPAKDYRITNQIYMTLLALKIGTTLGYSRRQLLEIGLCAYLSNLGMFLIPESITGKATSLTDSEMDAVRRHTEFGRNILAAFKQFPLLAEIAYQHHERDDGSGYPLGVPGSQIRDYAKIIGMVETYVAMTSNRPHREAMTQSFSAKELIKSGEAWFSPAIARAFLKAVSPYPVGSYVKLSNKSIGRVIATNPDLPMRPDVEILFDEKGRTVSDVVIKLSENPLWFIQRGLSADRVPKL